MESKGLNPGWRAGTIFLVGIALSIGWGIRGNFGHEYGAEFAGGLAAIAVALLSGREDWRNRVPYFAFFGALGWGFGASQSYMQVLSYTESGHAITQWYGYLAVFFIGFMWAALGGAGTAFAAVAPREKIISIFKPFLFILGSYLILSLIEDPVARWLQPDAGFDTNTFRHKNPLYWFDAYYLQAFFALLGCSVYDLYQRKGVKDRFFLPVFAIVGALSGWVIQLLLGAVGLDVKLAGTLTYPQGDPSYVNPATGKLAFDSSNFLNNWPQWFGDYPQHIGWLVGLIAGIAIYFIRYGKFRNGSSLFVYMACGWLIFFLLLPVLGGNLFADFGGIRMTPPRSDDWSGVLGVFIGTSLWMWRNDLKPVAVASLISGIIGGLGFSGIQWLKHFMLSFGSPRILGYKGILPGSEEFNSITAAWGSWQGQNWHSFLEQSYGFVNGIAIALALAFLASRVKVHAQQDEVSEIPNSRWTRAFSVLMVLIALTYFNVVKNVSVWGEQLNQKVWTQTITHSNGTTEVVPASWDVPYIGRLPGMNFLSLTPENWFTFTWLLLAAACILIVVRHYKEPLPIIPQSSLAKGQIIFLILLWIMVIANFERALTGWSPGRLLTEWVIILNAIIATVLILLLPKEREETFKIREETNYRMIYRRLWVRAVGALVLSSVIFLVTNRMIYHYPEYDKLNHSQYHTRFGPDASWRTKPNLKNGEGH
jgi:hypothetical protein